MPTKKYFDFVPALGRKTDVPQNDPTLFKTFEGIRASHDVGGINFDLSRTKHCCSKALGDTVWSNTTSVETGAVQGMFELYDSSANRNKMIMKNGVLQVYDGSKDPGAKVPFILSFDSGGGVIGTTTDTIPVPARGDTISEAGTGDASGVVARYEAYGAPWDSNGTGTGNIWLSESTGTWTDNSDLAIGTNTSVCTLDGTADSPDFSTTITNHTSMVRAGDYVVFSDRGTNIPYKWKHGDDYLTPLDVSGGDGTSAYKGRYLANFSRRIILAYCENDSSPELSIRWTSAWPGTSILNCNMSDDDQLYLNSDDPITGIKNLGIDRCYIYSERSISNFVYYPDYESPFRSYVVVPDIGGINNESIVNLWNYHIFLNEYYGFMRFDCSKRPVPVGEDIEADFQNVKWDKVRDHAVGRFIPSIRCAVWTLPMAGSNTPNRLVFYHEPTGQWFWEDKIYYFLSQWYDSDQWKLMLGGTSQHIYEYSGTSDAVGNLDGYRIEPIMDFGNPFIKKRVKEVWFEVIAGGDYSIDLSWRGGDTVKEVTAASWSSVGNVNINSPQKPVIDIDQTHRLHQMKWGTNLDAEDYQVNKITIGYYDNPGRN